jgi:serine/threonine-protein kinase
MVEQTACARLHGSHLRAGAYLTRIPIVSRASFERIVFQGARKKQLRRVAAQVREGGMIELRCLGSIDLRSPERDPASRVIAQPKRYALLAYLVLANPRGFHRRDTLIALFWPESDEEHARSGLRIGLSFLRRELGDDVIITRGDDVAVNRHVVRCDVDEFESALNAGDLENALALYRGDLLPGFHVSMSPEFERWLEAERERLRRRAHDAALKLSAGQEGAGEWVGAIKWLRFALNLAPDDEAVVQRLIQLFDRAGDRAGALRTYESFTQRMVTEFDAEPAPETRALVAGIRARSNASPDFAPRAVANPVIPVSTGKSIGGRAPPTRRRPWLVFAGVFALVAVSSAGAVLWQRQPHQGDTKTRIAIVALQNQTGRPDLDHVGGMVADQIAHGLGDLGLGDVVTLAGLPATKFATLVSPDPVHEIARETGARVVVTGGYTIEADSLLFRVEVADAERQRLLAVVGPVSASVASPSDGIAALSSQVLSSVARVLEPRLSEYMKQKGWSRATPIEVYRASSEGFELFLAAKSPATYERAIERFSRAYSLDSTEINALFEMAIIEQSLGEWARADSLLNRTNASRGRMSVLETDFLDLLRARNRGDHRQASLFARDAMQRLPGVVWEFTAGYHTLSAGRPRDAATLMQGLNPDKGFYKGVWAYRGVMAEAHHVLGEHVRELELARIQRERQPQLLSTALYEARALAALGRTEELSKLIGETESLPPQSGLIPALPPLSGLSPGFIMVEAGLELRAHGHPAESGTILERAIAWYQLHVKSDQRSQLLQEGLGGALYAANRWEDAGEIFKTLARQDPKNVDYQGYVALIAARQGRRSDAVIAGERLAKANDPYLFGRAKLWRARLAARLGDRGAAISLLRQSLAEGNTFGIGIHRDLDFEPLRGVRAFDELVSPRA